MAEWINDPQGREEIEKVTKELKLPVWKANHKGKFRDFWNELWDKIEDYILKLKGDTEKNSKGLNDRLVSAVGKHDGDFPIANAVVGNVYYSELTKKYYKCKVGGPAPMPNGNFVDMSILENLNRLENFSKYEFKNNWEQIINCESMSAQIITAGRILIQILTYNFNRKIDKTRLTFPKTFSATPFVTITDNDNAVTSRNLDYAIGWNTASYVDISNVVGGFTVLLIGVI